MMDVLETLSLMEALGLVSGLLCVWLLVRQNIWTWPVGIIYVFASLYVFHEARLYANFILHLLYQGMNVYGWYYWLKGGERSEGELKVTRENPRLLVWFSLLIWVGVLLVGFLFSHFTNAAVPYLDTAISLFSLLAIWLQSRKKLESWYFWLAIDLASVGMYLYQGILFYSLLYGIYILLAVMGWRAWQASMASCPEAGEARQ